ncbi:thiol:disulfide interchange protein DsbA/DsbL [Noviherbaspirillum autotrophicum]|uniref:Thiol:disulfide interchange protein DsbA n=1 Tax=Noviherbaspirillum autotrophicum TaxID=709839 RepID=A0A0C1YHY2_9BURK|nr:thiol:disulfide interchange protein DsbA/DsbL [Noviherbaspirillum autotrophicum]KIF80127.1 thiol:disulfide interchange protein DsbA [Noviherbaspirillum autotrophicum]
MRFLKHALAALSLGLVAITASAAPANPQNGVDYRTLNKPQQTESGKKVEVTEFFWYSCPHCFAFEPDLEAWVKKQGDNIAFKRVPVAFRDSMVPEQKLYYALEAMGKAEEMQKRIFNAIHVQRLPLNTDAAIVDYIAKQGIDKQKFLDVYNSFGIQSKVRRAAQLQQAYEIDGVPTMAIDGRFLTSPSIVSASLGNVSEPALAAGTLQVMDWLVAKVAKEKAPHAAPAAKAAPAKSK